MKGDAIVAVLFGLCVCVDSKKLPDYVKICRRNDPELSQCWQNSLKQIRPHLKDGIPEFNIPTVEPLIIDRLTLSEGNSSTVSFQAALTQLRFNGSGIFDVLKTYLNLDGEEKILNLELFFPRLTMSADYKAKGRVLLFRFNSIGEAKGEFAQIKLNGTWYLKVVVKKGQEHLTIVREEMDVTAGKLYFYLGDLFVNPQLTEAVNHAINQNIHLIYDDLKPLLSTTIGSVFTEYSNRAYSAFPYDVLFPTD